MMIVIIMIIITIILMILIIMIITTLIMMTVIIMIIITIMLMIVIIMIIMKIIIMIIFRHKLEVVSLMELGEVKAVFTRAGKFIPRYFI